jgi:hypothetical protein
MTQNTQWNGKQNPPVIGVSHGADNLLFLVGGKVTKKYPDEKYSYSQEYGETDYIFKFWIQWPLA